MQYLKFMLAVALAALLLCRPAEAALGALNAMLCWATTVAPAMFPFMALLPALTCDAAGRLYARLLGGGMERFLRLPGAAASAMVVGMVGGSPAGALAARRVKGLTRGQMKRLAVCACGMSPAFLIGGVGAGMLGDAALGRVLLRSQLAAQLLTPLLLRSAWRREDGPVFPLSRPEDEQPIRAAVAAILGVCGWMTLFGALGRAATALVGARLALPALCVADALSGLQHIARMDIDAGAKLCALAALCGFGGGCIALQNLAILRPIGVRGREYLCVRLLAAAEMAAFTGLQLRFARCPAALPPPDPLALSALLATLPAFAAVLFMKRARYLQCLTREKSAWITREKGKKYHI